MDATGLGQRRRVALIYLVAVLTAGVVLSRNVLGSLTAPPPPAPPAPPSRIAVLRFLHAADPGAAMLAFGTYGHSGYALYRNGRTWGYWSLTRGGQPSQGVVNVVPSGPHQPPLSVSEIWSSPALLMAVFDGRQAAQESASARIRWSDGRVTTVHLGGHVQGWIVPSPASRNAALVRWAAIVLYSRSHRPLFAVTPFGIRWYFPHRHPNPLPIRGSLHGRGVAVAVS